MICSCSRLILSRGLASSGVIGSSQSHHHYSVQSNRGSRCDSSWLFTHSSIQLNDHLYNSVKDVSNLKSSKTQMHTSTARRKISDEAAKYVQTPTWTEWWRQKVFKTRVSKSQLGRSGQGLTTLATHRVSVVDWFRLLDMPDTFYSWWLITELHAWMICVRVRVGNTPEGEQLMNLMVGGLWDDLEQRMKKVPGMTGSRRSNQIWDLAEEFQTALVLYDFGSVSDDAHLGNAIWKRFFLADEDTDPKKVELLVKYVRKTLAHLDNANLEDIARGDVEQEGLDWFDLEKVLKES